MLTDIQRAMLVRLIVCMAEVQKTYQELQGRATAVRALTQTIVNGLELNVDSAPLHATLSHIDTSFTRDQQIAEMNLTHICDAVAGYTKNIRGSM